MTSTGVRSLDRAIQNTMEWLNDVKKELGWPDDDRVYGATKAVLQALRDRLPPEEAIQLAAQLPMLMKGFYFDGYDPTDKPLTIRDRDRFYELVRERFGEQPLNAETATRAVLAVLYRRVSKGQMEDVKSSMPDALKGLFTAAEKS